MCARLLNCNYITFIALPSVRNKKKIKSFIVTQLNVYKYNNVKNIHFLFTTTLFSGIGHIGSVSRIYSAVVIV